MFTDCIGSDYSFGGDDGNNGGTASGTFINCTGGAVSFGGDSGDGSTLASTAKLQHCKGGNNSSAVTAWPAMTSTTTSAGRIRS